MKETNKKEDHFKKINDMMNDNPIRFVLIVSLTAAVFLTLVLLNIGTIISFLKLFTVAVSVLPVALVCVLIGIYLGVVLNRKKRRDAIKSDSDVHIRIGSVDFFHSWMKDRTQNRMLPAVTGPCCAVCGEYFWEADEVENDLIIFNCKKCGSRDTVKIREYESVKEDAERVIQKAYERLNKFKSRLDADDPKEPEAKIET
jgi:hypothetical protein